MESIRRESTQDRQKKEKKKRYFSSDNDLDGTTVVVVSIPSFRTKYPRIMTDSALNGRQPWRVRLHDPPLVQYGVVHIEMVNSHTFTSVFC